MITVLTPREYRDANKHIQAALDHLKLAAHYVQDDKHVLAMVDHHKDNVQILSKEMETVTGRAEERAS